MGKANDIFGSVYGWLVSKDAPKPKEALDFMKVWLGKETQTKLAAEGLSIPMVKGTAEAIQNPFYKALAVAVNHSGWICVAMDIDFFTSTIRNRNTRAAYARACWQFFEWCAAHSLELTTVRPFHVAAWIEDFPGSKPTIRLKLAAVRMLYDFLVVRQITRSNPAHSVRGPKYVVKKGKTPVWSREDAKTLLDSIPKDSVSSITSPGR